MLRVLLLLLAAGTAHAQNCPPIDLEAQKARQSECRVAGGQWQRWGIHDHLCNIYSCVERTKDAGKPCRNRADCEHQCITKSTTARIGAEAPGECAALKTSYGCNTYVDGGKIVGRICVD
jgi:hypothetical protein